tara:strand:- start:17 stop:247 length:231 start_codon:yes stop_codon:yes gene_type:complete
LIGVITQSAKHINTTEKEEFMFANLGEMTFFNLRKIWAKGQKTLALKELTITRGIIHIIANGQPVWSKEEIGDALS